MLIIFALLGFNRFYQFRERIIPVQRFTAESYFKSLTHFKHDNRFQFTRSCSPLGVPKTILEYNHSNIISIVPNKLFAASGQTRLSPENNGSFYSISVELDKKVHETPFSDVLLVIDAKDNDSIIRLICTTIN